MGALGPDCPARPLCSARSCSVIQSLISQFLATRIYIYIFRTLCPASSKLCKISPLLCDFHSLVQRLEERIGAIPYLRAQPPVSSCSLTSHLFPLIALHRILSCRQDLLPFHSAQWELPRWAENVLFTQRKNGEVSAIIHHFNPRHKQSVEHSHIQMLIFDGSNTAIIHDQLRCVFHEKSFL